MADNTLLPDIVGRPQGGGRGIVAFHPDNSGAKAVAAGLRGLVGGVKDAANFVGSVLDDRDNAALSRALVDANSERTRYLNDDVLQRQGVEAVNGATDFMRFSDDVRAKYMAQVPGRFREKFALMYDRNTPGMHSRAFNHGAETMRRDANEADLASVKQDLIGAAASLDNGAAAGFFDTAKTTFDGYAYRNGYSAERAKVEWQKSLDAAQLARIRGLVNRGRLAQAKDYLENWATPAGNYAYRMSDAAHRKAMEILDKEASAAGNIAWVKEKQTRFAGGLADAMGAYKSAAEAFGEGVVELEKLGLTPEEMQQRKSLLRQALHDAQNVWIAQRKRQCGELYDICVRGNADSSTALARFEAEAARRTGRMRPDDIAAVKKQLRRAYGEGGRERPEVYQARLDKLAAALEDGLEVRSVDDARKWWSAADNGSGAWTKTAETDCMALVSAKGEGGLLKPGRLQTIAKRLELAAVPPGFPAYLAKLVDFRNAKYADDKYIADRMGEYALMQAVTHEGAIWDTVEPMKAVDEEEWARGYLRPRDLRAMWNNYRANRRGTELPGALRKAGLDSAVASPTDDQLEAFARHIGYYPVRRKGSRYYYFQEPPSEEERIRQEQIEDARSNIGVY